MPAPHSRTTAHAGFQDRREEFVAAVEAVLPHLTDRLEGLALYGMLAAFWGVILYLALTFALH